MLDKHRAGLADDVRRVVFDDFIQVVDTLRFLAPVRGEAPLAQSLDDVLATHATREEIVDAPGG